MAKSDTLIILLETGVSAEILLNKALIKIIKEKEPKTIQLLEKLDTAIAKKYFGPQYELHGGALDLIDVVPAQLQNVGRKIAAADAAAVRFIQMDSSALVFSPEAYDRAVLYFLLHEEPQEIREKTVREALRVLKPGGTLVVLDYGKLSVWHPLRYLLLPILGTIEPFAVALWNRELWELLPSQLSAERCRKTSYFWGLYQKIVYVRPKIYTC